MNKKKAPDRSKPAPEQRSRRDSIVKWTLCVLVCLWMFVLGLLVGRGTAPVRFDIERLQDKLAGLKAATIEETIQRYQVAFDKLDREKNLGFHEALKDEETELPPPAAFVSDVSDEAAPEPAPVAVEETQASAEETAAGIPKKTKAPEFKKPSGAKQLAASDARKSQTAASAGTWAIQVAATKDEKQGRLLVERLQKMGYTAYLVDSAISGKGTWYRIRVGGYASRKAAEADVQKLKEEQFSPMILSP